MNVRRADPVEGMPLTAHRPARCMPLPVAMALVATALVGAASGCALHRGAAVDQAVMSALRSDFQGLRPFAPDTGIVLDSRYRRLCGASLCTERKLPSAVRRFVRDSLRLPTGRLEDLETCRPDFRCLLTGAASVVTLAPARQRGDTAWVPFTWIERIRFLRGGEGEFTHGYTLVVLRAEDGTWRMRRGAVDVWQRDTTIAAVPNRR